MTNTAILWFRRDLRLHDNPALNWVCENREQVLPIYIHSPEEEQPWAPGGASRWWLHHSLEHLDQQLKQFGLKLHFFSGKSDIVIENLIKQSGANTLVFNKLYEPHLHLRDIKLTSQLEKSIEVKDFDSGLFFKPGTILNNQQKPYRVFTPFYKKLRPILDEVRHPYSGPHDKQKLKKLNLVKINSDHELPSLQLLDEHPWHEKFNNYWQPGERHSSALLDKFIDEAAYQYDNNRDIPAVNGSSKLSAALHFGELTPQQIYQTLKLLLDGVMSSNDMAPAELFLKQLIWREFGHHILWHYPHTTSQPMNPRYKSAFWKKNKKVLRAWQRGETGIPIVDAGMKQLWETGWMHNRVRMIVSSFLTKNLGLHWLEGARWFWDTLVDADLANNSMGWQWVAGCGVDAAPYYRIFNPETQAKRFDPGSDYIHRWLPPGDAMLEVKPIVDLATSRQQALDRYKQYISS